MKPRALIAVAASLLAVGAATAGAQSQPTAPDDQQTHPSVLPRHGTRHTRFALRFTLRLAPGHEGVYESDYRIVVTRPAKSRDACEAPAPAPVDSGSAGERRRIVLAQPKHGWCVGRYHVTVFLQRGPYCPPPQQGEPPTPCPMFATQDLDAGETSFSVRRPTPP